MKLLTLQQLDLKKIRIHLFMNLTYLMLIIFAFSLNNCSSVKEYANSEDGKKMIETAKEKAKDKETQEKVKELIKEKIK